MSPSRSERRRKSRKRPLSLVYVELASGNGGMMRDLSDEGFAVRAMMPLHAGEKIPFAFSLNENIRIEGQGQILWVRENGHVAGVQFEEVPPSTREQIREWLTQRVTPRREQATEPQNPTLDQLRQEMHYVPPRPEGKSSVRVLATPTVSEPAVPEKQPPIHSVSPPREDGIPSETRAVLPLPKPMDLPIPEPVVTAKEPERHSVPPAPEKRIPVALPAPAVPGLPEPPVLEPRVIAKEAQPAPTKEPEQIASAPAAPVPIEAANPPRVPVASVSALNAPVVAQPERPLELVSPPEAEGPTENPFEEPAPALPRLTLIPKVVDPRLQPIASGLPLTNEPSTPEQHWEPAPLIDVSGSNAHAPELEPVLPDISSILIQPQRKTQRPAQQIATIERPASRDRQAPSAEGWTERFSLSRAVTMMAILTLLAGLYVFHRNVGQGLIWLGEALGGVPRSVAPTTSTNTGAADRAVETPSTPPNSSPGQTSSAANSGTSENAPNATGPSDKNPVSTNPPATTASPGGPPPAGINPPASSNTDTGQSEYAQAMQSLRGTNAEAATPEALRLLWISVEKGNANAELQLAEMYWRGHGVVRNCDQALILLTAAARKGSAEAQKRLLEFQKEGCE